jgi:GLPGLI family protein
MKMSKLAFVILVIVAGINLPAMAQTAMSQGTIVYDITIQTGSKDPQMADALDGATSTVYIKNSQSRTDMVSALGSESTIHDAKTGSGVILKEYSGQKLMITLTKDNWEEKNKKYNDIVFTMEEGEKTIAGYKCKKAVARLDGNNFTVYYCPDIVVTNKDFNATFKKLPGLVMQYEYEAGKLKFNYTVSKINTEPVLASKFDIPKSGYRVMTYEENQKLKKGNR